jgi:hypothetical protein
MVGGCCKLALIELGRFSKNSILDVPRVAQLLCRLPREVRDHVYSYLWDDDTMKELAQGHNANGPPRVKKTVYQHIKDLHMHEFPWPILGYPLSQEAAQWAYENIDAMKLYQGICEPTYDLPFGFSLCLLAPYLKSGIFDMDLAPKNLTLRSITMNVTEFEIPLSRLPLELLSWEVQFRKGGRVEFIIVERWYLSLPADNFRRVAAMLKPTVNILAARGVSVVIRATWKWSSTDNAAVLSWPCTSLLGATSGEWIEAAEAVLRANKHLDPGKGCWRVSRF